MKSFELYNSLETYLNFLCVSQFVYIVGNYPVVSSNVLNSPFSDLPDPLLCLFFRVHPSCLLTRLWSTTLFSSITYLLRAKNNCPQERGYYSGQRETERQYSNCFLPLGSSCFCFCPLDIPDMTPKRIGWEGRGSIDDHPGRVARGHSYRRSKPARPVSLFLVNKFSCTISTIFCKVS